MLESRIRLGRNGFRFLSTAADLSIASSSKTEIPDLHKSISGGTAHVTSVNVLTNERSIVELRKGSQKQPKFSREFVLPEGAVTALRNTLANCSRPIRQLQNEADVLAEKLRQRKFPASPEEVKLARNAIKRQLKDKDPHGDSQLEEDGLLNERITRAKEYELRSKVDKLLKKSRYNWRPLEFQDHEAAVTISPNYAEISRVLEEFDRINYVPKTVLDFGSGSGAGFWATHEKFGKNIEDYTMIEVSDVMTKASMDIMRDENGNLKSKNVTFRRNLLPSLQTTYDLVILHRTLGEIGSAESRQQLVESLWQRTNRFLVIIDSAMDESFRAVLDARDYLITSGMMLNEEATAKLLKKKDLWNEEIGNILTDRRLSHLERFHLLKEMLPQDFLLPTQSSPATVFAPCPHDLGCPSRAYSACTFPVRWRSLRADGKQKNTSKDGTETGNFSFVIMQKDSRQPFNNAARILKSRKMNGHTTCDICTAFKGLQRLTVSKRAGDLYKSLRNRRDGDLFPLDFQTKATESMFDLYESNSK